MAVAYFIVSDFIVSERMGYVAMAVLLINESGDVDLHTDLLCVTMNGSSQVSP